MTPLSDLRVIEMGQLLAGPFCGQLLADFGAEVIKIEPPGVARRSHSAQHRGGRLHQIRYRAGSVQHRHTLVGPRSFECGDLIRQEFRAEEVGLPGGRPTFEFSLRHVEHHKPYLTERPEQIAVSPTQAAACEHDRSSLFNRRNHSFHPFVTLD